MGSNGTSSSSSTGNSVGHGSAIAGSQHSQSSKQGSAP
jgi:hypothetical protein